MPQVIVSVGLTLTTTFLFMFTTRPPLVVIALYNHKGVRYTFRAVFEIILSGSGTIVADHDTKRAGDFLALFTVHTNGEPSSFAPTYSFVDTFGANLVLTILDVTGYRLLVFL